MTTHQWPLKSKQLYGSSPRRQLHYRLRHLANRSRWGRWRWCCGMFATWAAEKMLRLPTPSCWIHAIFVKGIRMVIAPLVFFLWSFNIWFASLIWNRMESSKRIYICKLFLCFQDGKAPFFLRDTTCLTQVSDVGTSETSERRNVGGMPLPAFCSPTSPTRWN